MINLHNYMSKIRQRFNNNGLILEHPDNPLEFIKIDGQIIAMEAYRFRIKFSDGNSLIYSEKGFFEHGLETSYKIELHKYHYNAKSQGSHPFRVDLDKKGLHAHQCDDSKVMYDTNPSLPYHLHFPDDIDFNIENFNLALAIDTSLIYKSSNRYPLEKANAGLYNKPNQRLRRQLIK